MAGTVLALFGGAVAIAATQAGVANRRGIERRLAAERLDAVLTKIDVLGPARVGAQGPFSGELEPGPRGRPWSWSVAIALEGTWADLYTVQVTIHWTSSAGGARALVGRTRLFDPAGSRTVRAGWDEL